MKVNLKMTNNCPRIQGEKYNDGDGAIIRVPTLMHLSPLPHRKRNKGDHLEFNQTGHYKKVSHHIFLYIFSIIRGNIYND